MRFERTDFRALGRKIRALREQRNWSLRRLSKISGVSLAAVQRIEAGSANPSLFSVVSIVDALGASLDRLVSGPEKSDKIVRVVRGALPSRASGDVSLSEGLNAPKMISSLVALAGREHRDAMISIEPVFGYVLDGGLRLRFNDDESAVLSTGDSFHIAAGISVEWANPLPRRSQILTISEAGAMPRRSRQEGRR